MATEFHGIDVSTKHTRRSYTRNSTLFHFSYQVLDEFRALADSSFVQCFVHTYSHRFDFTYRDTTVSQETFEQRNEGFHLLVKFALVSTDTATTRRSQLAGREVNDVCQTGHHLQDFAQRVFLPLVFALLDEVSVFTQQRCIENEHNTILVCNAANVHQVRHGEWLATNQVSRCFHTDVRDVFLTFSQDQFFQLFDVHVTLERIVALEFHGTVVIQLGNTSTHFLNVCQSSCKVVVHWYYITLLDECLSQDVFASTTLVSRQQILLAHNIFYGLLQADE